MFRQTELKTLSKMREVHVIGRGKKPSRLDHHRWPDDAETGGRMILKWVAGPNRNGWPDDPEMRISTI